MENNHFGKKRPQFGGKRLDFKGAQSAPLFAQGEAEVSAPKESGRIEADEETVRRIKPEEYFWKGRLPVIDERDKIEIDCPNYDSIPVQSEKTDLSYENHDGMTEIVGVRFHAKGKVYYFLPYITDANGIINSKIIHTKSGDSVVVDTAHGMEIGTIFVPNKFVENEKLKPLQPMRSILRIATEEDLAISRENREIEKQAEQVFVEKVNAHGLQMKLIDIQYAFDRSKLMFFFSSEGRVDFRELVRELASIFHTRIELRQIGIRDEARIMGGIGACGRPLCCSSFLSDFVQVSIKMAKSQVTSLNPSKISGCCGRLMCCLRYENDIYEEEISKTPPVDSAVKTEDGYGVVTEINPLAGFLKVKLIGNADQRTGVYHRDSVEVVDQNDPEYLLAVEKQKNAIALSAVRAAERQPLKASPIPSPSANVVKVAASDSMFDEAPTATAQGAQSGRSDAEANRRKKHKRRRPANPTANASAATGTGSAEENGTRQKQNQNKNPRNAAGQNGQAQNGKNRPAKTSGGDMTSQAPHATDAAVPAGDGQNPRHTANRRRHVRRKPADNAKKPSSDS